MPGDEEIRTRLLGIFRVEAQEHVQALTANLLALERAEAMDSAAVRDLTEASLREAHSLKGAARSVGLGEIEHLCQEMETTFRQTMIDQVPLSRAVVRGLDEIVGRIGGMLETGGEEAPHADTPVPERPSAAPETLRVGRGKLDALLAQAEEILVSKPAAEGRTVRAQVLADAATRARRALGPTVPPDLLTVEREAALLVEQLRRDERTIARGVDALHEVVRQLRLAPAATVLDVLPRMTRDLAAAQGKEVDLIVSGGELELDRQVLEAVKDPLVHLVRNAVDHGIEPPDARARAGKGPRARISVTVKLTDGGRVEISVQDDGGGVDLAQVRLAAVRAGVVSEDTAAQMTEDAALAWLFHSGLSTSREVTEISGHGVGLAIVRERVEALGGQARLQSKRGVGATIRLTMPASISTLRSLLLGVGTETFLLPVDAVEQAFQVKEGDVVEAEGQRMIRWQDQALPIERLDWVLQVARSAEERQGPTCVVLKSGDHRAGVIVDELLGVQELLLKPLQAPLSAIQYVAGAGLLGTGQVALVLNPRELVSAVLESTALPSVASAAPEHAASVVLVADDSITSRAMLSNILAAAGYEVRLAVDGMDAWTLLQREPCDVLVADVDMPRLDGFSLTTRVRSDTSLSDLPVVLVTALDSREHKERGLAAGANAYFVKSSFDESNLLETVRRLIA